MLDAAPMAPPRIGRALRLLLVAPLILASSCVFGSKSSASETPTATTSPQRSSAGGCLLQTDPAVSGIHGNLLAAVTGSGPTISGRRDTFRRQSAVPFAQHWDGSSWDTAMAGEKKFHALQLNKHGCSRFEQHLGQSLLLLPAQARSTGTAPHGRSYAASRAARKRLPRHRRRVRRQVDGGKASGAGAYDVPIVQRSDGSSWTTVLAPVPAATASGFRDVAAEGRVRCGRWDGPWRTRSSDPSSNGGTAGDGR